MKNGYHFFKIAFGFFVGILCAGSIEAQVINTFPYSQDFGSGGCTLPAGYTNTGSDPWDHQSNSETYMLGGDHTTGSTCFLSMDDSGGSSDDSCLLTSPTMDMTSLPCAKLTFWWQNSNGTTSSPHTTGPRPWSNLYVDMSDDNGATWTRNVFMVEDSAQVGWAYAEVNITNFATTTTKFRIRGLETQSFRSDLSVDDITVEFALPCAPVLNDAGVTDIISPIDECAGYMQDVEVEITNLGDNQINSVEVHWTINNTAQTVFNYTSLLDTANGTGQDSAIVILGTIALTAGVSETIVAWTEMPNNVVDSTTANDTSDVIVKGHNSPTVSIGAVPGNNLCFGTPFLLKATSVNAGSTMYQWKINTVNVGAPTASNLLTTPSLMSGDSVNVDLITDDCDTTGTYAVPSNYITMTFSPEPKLISGSAETDTVVENTSENYLVPVDSLSTFTWSANGGSIASPVGNSTTVEWGSPMDTAKIMVTEKDAGNCSYTNVRNVVIISIVGVKAENNLIGIGYAYPNPANTTVTIPLVIDGDWNIDLSLYDMTGKKVKAIFNGEVSGNRDFTFAVDDLQNGMYFYKVTTSDGYESVKKLSIEH